MSLKNRLRRLERDALPDFCPFEMVVIMRDGTVRVRGEEMPVEAFYELREEHDKTCPICQRRSRLGLVRGIDFRLHEGNPSEGNPSEAEEAEEERS